MHSRGGLALALCALRSAEDEFLADPDGISMDRSWSCAGSGATIATDTLQISIRSMSKRM
jgi:hypothetical protein